MSVAAAASTESDLVYEGVGLVLAAVALVAVGANVQRVALRDVPPDRRICCCVSARTALWLAGLCIYFFANVLYTFGLVYAPASLCATLMAAIIPINAITSRIILGETLELVDVEGGLSITLGITLAAFSAPYTTASFTAPELAVLVLAPPSVALLATLGALLVALGLLVLCHEAIAAHSSRALAPAMPFAYPVVVGLLESLVQIAQKGGSSMVALTAAGHSQLDYPMFWYMVGAWAGFSIATVWWLRKGLANLAANRMLPIEYGTFTAVSVLAGLVVYDEAEDVPTGHRYFMAAGVLLVVVGCALVGSRRAARCKCAVRCTSDDEEDEARGLGARLLPRAAKRSDTETGEAVSA